jgi:transcriptional regulator with XRE-family HTH domain
MDDFRVGSAIRLVRQRRGWRQRDLEERSGVSQTVISRMERGHLGAQSLDDIRAVAGALDMRIDLVARWRAGDLDRLLNGGHSALHESVARMFRDKLPAWVLAPEVSFAIYAERGLIDILAWHPGRRALLVIELKTDLADMNELVGTFDRKRRLARQVALERGWDPVSVSAWLIVVDRRTNRRRVAAHEAMLRGALPDDGRTMAPWLRDPSRAVAGLSFWAGGASRSRTRPIRRVRLADKEVVPFP